MTEHHTPLPIPSPSDTRGHVAATFVPSVATRVELMPAVRPDAAEGPSQAAPGDFKQYARVVHRSLRGRYALTLALALVFALIGAAAAWKFVRPTYHSEALLRIAYTLPAVMQETDQNGPMAMFDTFMLS